MQDMVEILQPRSQSLSSSLSLGLLRETGNEVGKDLDIRHFEVEREIGWRWLSSALCDCFGEQICRHVENGPLKPKTVPQCT